MWPGFRYPEDIQPEVDVNPTCLWNEESHLKIYSEKQNVNIAGVQANKFVEV